jgi:hypothetical protein
MDANRPRTLYAAEDTIILTTIFLGVKSAIRLCGQEPEQTIEESG